MGPSLTKSRALFGRPAERGPAARDHDRPLHEDRISTISAISVVVERAGLEAKFGVAGLAFAQEIRRLDPELAEDRLELGRGRRRLEILHDLGFSPRASSSPSVARDFEQRGL